MMRHFLLFLSLSLICLTFINCQESTDIKNDGVTAHNYLPSRDIRPDTSARGFFKYQSRGISLLKRNNPTYPDWMSQKRDNIGNKKLTQLVFPGTHDSGAFSLTPTILQGQLDKSTQDIVSKLGHLGIPAGKVLMPWSLSQDQDLYSQLVAGARFLDMRCGFDGKDWVTFHMLIGKKISELLPQIRRFLDEHTGEILLVEFTHLEGAAQSDGDRDNLANMIESALGPHMHPRSDGGALGSTYNQVIASGKRAFVSLGSPKTIEGRQNFWFENMIKNTWANSDNIDTVTKFNWDKLNEFNNNNFDNQLYKVSWTLTASGDTAIKGLNPFKRAPSTLIKLADTINDKLNDFLNQVKSKTNKKIPGNVFILDHFQAANVQAIIDLNN